MKFKDLLIGTLFTFHKFETTEQFLKVSEKNCISEYELKLDEPYSVNQKVYIVIGQSYYDSILSIARGYGQYTKCTQFTEDMYQISVLNS